MPLALTDEHEALRVSTRRWLDAHCPPALTRAVVDGAPGEGPWRGAWEGAAARGWGGLHLPEAHGGQGFGLLELAVVLEETGRSLLPGPLLPTVVVAALVAEAAGPVAAARHLPGLAAGETTAALAVGPVRLEAAGAAGLVSGTARPLLGPATAGVVLVPVTGSDGADRWCLLEPGAGRAGLRLEDLPGLDATRPLAGLTAEEVAVGEDARLPALTTGRVRQVLLALLAAEHVGGARWCLETATEHAKVRVQFGRPIGQFQAVKHRLADMAVRVEQMTAVAWDAAVAVEAGDDDGADLAAATAGALCVDGFARTAKECLQLLGGIGFTWEHDLHLYLKRALADRQLAGDADGFCRQVAGLALSGARRPLGTDLPAEAEEWRRRLTPVVEDVHRAAPGERRARMVASGLVAPHWPRPWGRDAGAVEQVVLDGLLAEAGIERPHLLVGAWALPPIIAHGTEAQCERWVRPTLLGQLTWCQLFSEPGAGSDLASLTTRADRVDGGWALTGQKVWTSMAHVADWGICLVRTDPSAPKHEGITFVVVDMRAPGIEVRPLRELTGAALFNEVFLDGVLVPDDQVIGEVDRGWPLARMTLANERVSISSGATFGVGVEAVLRLAARGGGPLAPELEVRLGALLAEAQSLRLLAHRSTLRSLAGADPGPGSSMGKLLGAEHEQRVQELGLALLGPDGATTDGAAGRWTQGVLATRCLTIAGGTSEVQRNVIGERILGLPRDPEPGT